MVAMTTRSSIKVNPFCQADGSRGDRLSSLFKSFVIFKGSLASTEILGSNEK